MEEPIYGRVYQIRKRPDVILDFVFERGLFFIEIGNIGLAPAYRVSVTFNPEIKGAGGSKLISQMALFQRIEFMPPSKHITTFLDVSALYFQRGEPLDIETTVVFYSRWGTRYSNRIKHNLGIYRDIGYV